SAPTSARAPPPSAARSARSSTSPSSPAAPVARRPPAHRAAGWFPHLVHRGCARIPGGFLLTRRANQWEELFPYGRRAGGAADHKQAEQGGAGGGRHTSSRGTRRSAGPETPLASDERAGQRAGARAEPGGRGADSAQPPPHRKPLQHKSD